MKYSLLIFDFIFFFLWFLISILVFINKRITKKYNIIVNAKIKSLVFDNSSYTVNMSRIIKCEFYYNDLKEKKLLYNNSLKNVSIGDTFKCVYNIQNQSLKTIEVTNNKWHYIIYLLCFFYAYIFLEEANLVNIDFSFFNNSFIKEIFIPFLCCLVFLVVGFVTYRNGKIPDNFIIVDGIIKDICVKHDDEKEYRLPVFEFNYNEKNIVYSSKYSTKLSPGDKIKIYYDPINEIVLEEYCGKEGRKTGIVLMISSILLFAYFLFF